MPLNALYAQLRQLQARLLGLPIGGYAYCALLQQIQALKTTIERTESGGHNWSHGL